MDLDSDGRYCGYSTYRQVQDSPPAYSPSKNSDVSDMDIDSPPHDINSIHPIQTAMWSASMGQVNQAVKAFMTISTEDSFPSQEQSQTRQPTHNPPSTPQASGFLAAQRSLSWSLSDEAAVRVKKEKTGYGIPDDDPTFAHFPEYGFETDSLRQRIQQPLNSTKDTTLQSNLNTLIQSNDESIPEKDLQNIQNITKKSKNSTSKCGCMKIFMKIFLIMVITFSILVYLGWHRRQCQLSRKFDHESLVIDLKSYVIGQHIATEIVAKQIFNYFEQLNKVRKEDDADESNMCKPLVLAFHGMTGVGKTYTSKIIAQHFNQTKLPVPFLNIPHVFPHKVFDEKYSEQVSSWMLGNVTSCETNVFVLDELDKASDGVVAGIVKAVRELTKPCHLADPVIILLLSNSNSMSINKRYVMSDIPRDQLNLGDFLADVVLDTDQWYSNLKPSETVDTFVPFLPLEHREVGQCIHRDLTAKGYSNNKEMVDKVLKELTFHTFGKSSISSFGCKRVPDKVDFVMTPSK